MLQNALLKTFKLWCKSDAIRPLKFWIKIISLRLHKSRGQSLIYVKHLKLLFHSRINNGIMTIKVESYSDATIWSKTLSFWLKQYKIKEEKYIKILHVQAICFLCKYLYKTFFILIYYNNNKKHIFRVPFFLVLLLLLLQKHWKMLFSRALQKKSGGVLSWLRKNRETFAIKRISLFVSQI